MSTVAMLPQATVLSSELTRAESSGSAASFRLLCSAELEVQFLSLKRDQSPSAMPSACPGSPSLPEDEAGRMSPMLAAFHGAKMHTMSKWHDETQARNNASAASRCFPACMRASEAHSVHALAAGAPPPRVELPQLV